MNCSISPHSVLVDLHIPIAWKDSVWVLGIVLVRRVAHLPANARNDQWQTHPDQAPRACQGNHGLTVDGGLDPLSRHDTVEGVNAADYSRADCNLVTVKDCHDDDKLECINLSISKYVNEGNEGETGRHCNK
jgi:hypothetical protein